MSSLLRQWWPVALAGIVIALLIGAGWFIRDRFAPATRRATTPMLKGEQRQFRSL
jgi:hypothetical protein